MRRFAGALVLLTTLAADLTAWAQGRPVPRTILALYDGELDTDIRVTQIHKIAEMPLNHLGIVVAYHDLRKPLPSDRELEGVRGALAWFSGDVMPNPLAFAEWAHRFIDGGRKLVMIGGLGMANDRRGKATPIEVTNGVLQRIGLRFDDRHGEFTQDVRVVRKDRAVLDFEAVLPRQLPAYDRIVKIEPRTHAHLILREGIDIASDATLISTHPNGGMVVGDFVHRGDPNTQIK